MNARRVIVISATAVTLTGCGPTGVAQSAPHGVATVTGYLAIYGGGLFTPRSGQPQVGGTVQWTDTVTGKVFSARTKAKGTYVVELPAGTYRVVAGNGRGWPMGSCEWLINKQSSGPVTLTAGEHLRLNVGCMAM